MATRLDMMRRTIAGEVPPPPIALLLGFRMTAIEPGRSRFELDADARHHNPMGTLHGGVLCDIADVAMGSAYASTLEEGESFTTLELKINFLRPVRAAHLVADGVLVQRGRTVGMVECAITDERGRLIARATSTCLTLRGEQAEGR
ncbi:MAG TPA: PaaI family thioesterase [Vicinamibacterales bacterium]|nr:PaaI family thioesterase [Vicinamibacterales bacterium]